MLSGYDISHHNYKTIAQNGGRHLRMVARDGFIIMKATEGRTFDDPRCLEYARTIGDAAILQDKACVGFYHYARPEYNSAAEEAQHFVNVIRPYIGHAFLALDFEGRALSVPDGEIWARKWLDTVKLLTGVKPVLYVQKSDFKRFENVAAADYGLWLAAWQKGKPKDIKPWPIMALWQYDTVGLDKDLFFGSAAAWHKYAESRR